MQDSYNILFCGLGGQGILTASELTGVAAMNAGYHVKKSEIHGMSQRGGSVESHIRLSKLVHSPLIMPGKADFLVCFDAAEGDRFSFYLKPDGIDFRPMLSDALAAIPDKRYLNTYLSGILSLYLPIKEDVWFAALKQVVRKALPENEQVFRSAREKGRPA